MIALTRSVGPALADCALTFRNRQSIDIERAAAQHRAYEQCLRELGLEVISLPAEPDLPDAVFVEDTAVVVDQLAIMTHPALESRYGEIPSIAKALGAYRDLRYIEGVGCLEGGDVMRIDNTVFVGLSARTNSAGLSQLANHLEPLGYRVQSTVFHGCLHLKSACTCIGRNTVLANRDHIEVSQLNGLAIVDVDPDEPDAGNALIIGGTVIMPASFPATVARLRRRGFEVQTLDVSELQKAEAGVTCCSILFEVTAG